MHKIQPMAEGKLTSLLQKWGNGDETALELLVPVVYQQLKNLARQQMFEERSSHTLQPTALVNEAYVRLLDGRQPRWQDRAHFFAVAARVMRHVLVDHARARSRKCRGGGVPKVSLGEGMEITFEHPAEMLALDDALKGLEALDARKAQVVQLRFFGGLSLDETAEVLKVSQVTVVRDWRLARTWLLREMRQSHPTRSASNSA